MSEFGSASWDGARNCRNFKAKQLFRKLVSELHSLAQPGWVLVTVIC